MVCVICGAPNPDPAHIRSKGAGGHDIDENVIPLCRQHHMAQHVYGWEVMINKYPQLAEKLMKLGWVWGDQSPTGKLFHEDLWPIFRDGRKALE